VSSSINKIRKLCVILFSITIIIGCGGGGGGGSDDPDESVGGGIPPEFDLFDQPGIWLLTTVSQFSIDSEIDTVDLVTSGNVIQVSPEAFSRSNGNVSFISCDAGTPFIVAEDSIDLFGNFIEDISLLRKEDCDPLVENYIKNSSSSYSIEFSCGTTASLNLEFVKLSDQDNFDFGSFSFESTINPDLNANTGVCGSIIDGTGTTEYLPQPNDLNLLDETRSVDTITVGAPYNGNIISMEMSFPGGANVGTYTVVNFANDASEVGVFLESYTFGGSPGESPGGFDATSGTVTISAVSTNSASGNFNITVENTDTMIGSFDFTIQ